MTVLYICIDESGNHSRDNCYAIAGCWHVSPRPNPQNVLASTKDKLLSRLQDLKNLRKQPGELKGASIEPDEMSVLMSEFKGIMYEEDSIRQSRLPWRMSFPVGFTLTSMNGQLFRSAVADYNGKLEELELLQIGAVSSVLDPVFHESGLDLDAIDEVRVLFDATTWDTVSAHIDRFVDEPNFEFETRDSQNIPGIQFADLAAYSWRRNTLEGDYVEVTSILHDLRFSR